jgi:molecular chaperone GrpE
MAEEPASQGPDPGSSPSPPSAGETARVAELEDKLQRFRETLARVQADFENYRKRIAREKDETAAEARTSIVRVLVDVLDDVERAGRHAADATLRDGLALIASRISGELTRLGVVKIAPGPGDAFDPDVHDAVMTVATDEQPPGTIVAMLTPGYSLSGRLVRPAMVQVAAAPAT